MPLEGEVEVLGEDVASLVKPTRMPAHAWVRIWFFNNAGAQTLDCPAHEANEIRRRLIAEGAVVYHSQVFNA